ncbi:hypothetical protein [Rhodovulum sp. MB263]|uniref:hypothetical protein n=1 Tax=Rhodovulum sp. (strain MB263) TaxID=308754 RepID=UPI0009B7410F|nr:hypothetical protein [Rhodovulum sp. MB263]ARC90671.1 hypothetical protein B5V46_18480 [Rhodovulum sp. MB263]
MDPVVTGSLISGGASLLGGLFGSKKKAKYVVPDYGKIRARAEAAGFNPLTALTSAPGAVASAGQNYMGQAIADAGLLLADGLAKKAEKTGELQKAREQNAQLKERVQQLTIRPRVGGIYASNVNTPSIRAAVGGEHGVPGKSRQSVSLDSPFAGDILGPDDGNRTGPQLAVTKDVPAFRAFGHDFYGSGNFSTGQQIEDSIGEGPFSWLWPSLTVPDAFLNEAFKATGRGRYRTHHKGSPIYTLEDGQRYALQPPDKPSLFQRFNTYRKWWER